jgi:hypothetical protein
VPTDHLKLVATDHDLQVLDVLVAPREPGENSPEDEGHERPHHGGLPALELLSDPPGLLLGTPLLLNECTLQYDEVVDPDHYNEGAGQAASAGLFADFGWSGHGFKHAPVIGDILSDVVLAPGGRSPAAGVVDRAPPRQAPLADAGEAVTRAI